MVQRGEVSKLAEAAEAAVAPEAIKAITVSQFAKTAETAKIISASEATPTKVTTEVTAKATTEPAIVGKGQGGGFARQRRIEVVAVLCVVRCDVVKVQAAATRPPLLRQLRPEHAGGRPLEGELQPEGSRRLPLRREGRLELRGAGRSGWWEVR